MASSDDPEPVGDGELLLRRIPAFWYKPHEKFIDPMAFRPNEFDTTGLSLARAKFHGAKEEAAKGRHGKRYYVALLLASDLKRLGATVVARAEAGNPGHAEIPELTYGTRKSDKAVEMIDALLKSVKDVEGPFDGQTVHA